MLFPVKFADIDPQVIREKLFRLYEEGIAREDIAQIELRLKSHFLDESLEVIVTLATDIFNTVKDQNTIDVSFWVYNILQEFFRYKSHIYNAPLGMLTAQKLIENLAAYKAFKRQERIEIIGDLKNSIDSMYADEKIKEEKLIEYTDGLVRELKRTSIIQAFSKQLKGYMPKYNELKHFNPAKIAEKFISDIAQFNVTVGGGKLGVTKLMAGGMSGNPSNTMTFY